MILHKEDFDAIRDLIKEVLREEKEAEVKAGKPADVKAEKEKK
jgi:hypothetical protein